ncbi:monooxygenase [Corticibacter populi]|uniref:Dibenzothiophene monooxygenase n=2 Tax=Corticibacter populi TaxID=1550736 RepID=A0A3M6R199_9BURK|nr:monooxygenase [Corticibacter populi]RZS36020.1 alkylation response protein AidB-like acyl-CoA dehydrogenase [Corticibacter populi]
MAHTAFGRLTLGVDPADWSPYAQSVQGLVGQLAETAVDRDRQGGTARLQRSWLRESGLLNLAIPAEYGGGGASWPLILAITRRLAEADSSIAHLFGFQHLQVASVLLFGSPAQQSEYLTATVKSNWFWGNAVNARDTRLQASRDTQGVIVLQGSKSYCSGAADSDVLAVSVALGERPQDRIFAVVPTGRAGITVHDDWDSLGQRQTDSGTVSFEQVRIDPKEVLGPPGVASSPRATLRNIIGQLILTDIYLGNAVGALQAAIKFVQEEVQPWPMSGADRAVEDRFLQLRVGELWTQLRSAIALANEVNHEFQQAWERGSALTEEERGVLTLSVGASRAHAAEVALHVTARIFELLGARATARKYGFDRYWRNVRVHTLHDPLDYRRRSIGDWLLTGSIPDPYGYS